MVTHKTHTIPFFILPILFFVSSNNLISQTIEKIHLTTDKNLYAPEDTVWFKAYTFGRDNVLSDESISLKVVVSDTEGNKLKDTSWPILQGMAEGYFVTPKDEGKYLIAAISGQMIGSSPDMAFTRSFFVRSELVDDVQLSAFLRSDPQHISDSLVVDVYSRINPTSPAPDYRFSYELWTGEKRLDNGNRKTNEAGEFRLRLTDIPSNLSSYRLIIKSNEGNKGGDYQFTLPIETAPGPIDLQFFPEGGELLAGVPNRVAFKAMKGSGKPIDIKAVLLSESGQVLDTISSSYQGMGSFNLIPKEESYKVKIIEPFEVETKYSLPSIAKRGIALGIVQGQESKLIKLTPSPNSIEEEVKISIHQFGQEVHSFKATINHRQFFELPEEVLRPGVASVMISTISGEPLAERLFFTKPDSRINVKLTTDKKQYTPREEVLANIEVLDENGEPVAGSFSFSAIDLERSISPVDDQPNLMAQILLKSVLKGFIPTPNFYFSGHAMAAEALDLVMLSNGWRKFVPSRFEDAEGIEGFILRNNNKRKRINDKILTVMDLETFNSESIDIRDEKFHIKSDFFKYQGDSFLITANQYSRKDKFSIIVSDSVRLTTIKTLLSITEEFKQINGNFELYQLPYKLREDRFNNTLLLNTVVVESGFSEKNACVLQDYHFEKPWKTKFVAEMDMTSPGILVQIKAMDKDISGWGNIYIYNETETKEDDFLDDVLYLDHKFMTYKIPVRVFINCDEIRMIHFMPPMNDDYQFIKTIEAIDFSNLEAISFKVGNEFSLPILVIHTLDDKVNYNPTFKRFKIHRSYTHISREFYSPVYDTQEKIDDQVPDLRTTIFWQASVVTDENGKAQVSFYNADRPNKIQITVEGVDVYSSIGFSQMAYQVVEK